MASGALFGNTGSRSQSKHLVEFRAGKMHMKGKMVHPDKRKGQVYVYQSDDMLMHFCWKDRTKGTVEDDLIIFPEDVEFKNVVQCTTGRVYVLKFKSTSRKMFFWMQEPKTDKDDDFCKKVNDFLNNPPEPGSRSGGGGSGLSSLPPELAAGLGGDSDIQSLLGNMTQPQLMQLFGGIGGIGGLSSLLGGRPGSSQSDSNPPSRVQSSPGPRAPRPAEVTSSSQPTRPLTAAAIPETHAAQSTPPPTQTAAAADPGDSSRQPQIQLSDLQTILTGLGGEEGKEKESIDLAAAITPDAMIPILANSEIQERLIAFLPEGESLPKTEEELRSTVKSPQFQQALQSFGAALTSGQLGPLMAQFDLGEDVVNAAAAGDLEAFTKAMQEALKKKEEKAEDQDEEMKE